MWDRLGKKNTTEQNAVFAFISKYLWQELLLQLRHICSNREKTHQPRPFDEEMLICLREILLKNSYWTKKKKKTCHDL